MKINVQLSSINVKKINTMRKFMNMPDVKVVRFENKDIVTASNEPNTLNANFYSTDATLVQERRSIWE